MRWFHVVTTTATSAAITSALLAVPLPASADGMNNPDEARALCQKRGQAGTPAALKSCCSNLILVGDLKKQKQLEAQCASPVPAATAASGAKKS